MLPLVQAHEDDGEGVAFFCGCNTCRPRDGSGHAACWAGRAAEPTSEAKIGSLFDRWNQSLQTADAHKAVANYAGRSILLPTVSDTPRLTPDEKEDYLHRFLENRPSGKIDMRFVEIACNTAIDAGLYTFTFAKTGAVVSGRYTYHWNGSEWRGTRHHCSMMHEPQEKYRIASVDRQKAVAAVSEPQTE